MSDGFHLGNGIYIPIWLDLLFGNAIYEAIRVIHLHSNMVRFIMTYKELKNFAKSVFTFQYG